MKQQLDNIQNQVCLFMDTLGNMDTSVRNEFAKRLFGTKLYEKD